MAHPNSASDVQVKTFHIQSNSDEQAVNAFLAGKIVRHWSATFSPAISDSASGSPAGAWNVFVAYEHRMEQDHREQSRSGNAPRRNSDRNGQNNRQEGGRQESSRQPASQARSEKAVNEEYKPQISDADFPLFDAVRKWRNTRAREARVKPYSFFNNRQLEQIITTKPTSTEALHSIASDMTPELWDKYHNELLSFIDTARMATQSSILETPAEAVSA
ncbi:MAG TPA: HRDC domain-containing protein [Candidatus Kapabacteria bacterium]